MKSKPTKQNLIFAILTLLCIFMISQVQAAPAQIISPTNGSALTSTTVTFRWENAGAAGYMLSVGTTPGSSDINGVSFAKGVTSTTIKLPNYGRKIYVRLQSLINRNWQFKDYIYTSYTTIPTLSKPDNGQSDWLFNENIPLFKWEAITGATGVSYRIVVSRVQDFSGFRENGGNSSCDPSLCVTFATAQTSVSKKNLANFWWKAGTYYWHVRSSTTINGVSDWSTTRSFTTTSLPGIVTNAINAVGASPQSIVGHPWVTDMDGNDGVKIRNAISVFNNWVNKAYGRYSIWVGKGKPKAPQNIQDSMRTYLKATYTKTNDQSALIERIQTTFAGSVPADDNGTLALLQIRAQCKEFADRMVSSVTGGQTHNFPQGKDISTDVRPGMYAFIETAKVKHVAIITEVKFDGNGNPLAHLVESNWGQGWSNPSGQVPWERMINVRQQEVPIGGDYKAVKTTK